MKYFAFCLCIVSCSFVNALHYMLSLSIEIANKEEYRSLSSSWKDNGINGKYNPTLLSAAKNQLDKINNIELETLVGYCRAHFILSKSVDKIINNKYYDELSPDMKAALKKHGVKFYAGYVTENTMNNASLFAAFHLPWKECMRVLAPIFQEGAFSHKYTVGEALFILHACPRLGLFQKADPQQKDKYTRCVAAALKRLMYEIKKNDDGCKSDGITLMSEAGIKATIRDIVIGYLNSVSKEA